MSTTTPVWPLVAVHGMEGDDTWCDTSCPTCGMVLNREWPAEVREAVRLHDRDVHGGTLTVYLDRLRMVDARELATVADDLTDLTERAAALLVEGGNVADGEEVREAVEHIDARVLHHLANGATVDSAVAAVSAQVADRLASHVLFGIDTAEATRDYAVTAAIEAGTHPPHWWGAARR